jgi:hypothetical protein
MWGGWVKGIISDSDFPVAASTFIIATVSGSASQLLQQPVPQSTRVQKLPPIRGNTGTSAAILASPLQSGNPHAQATRIKATGTRDGYGQRHHVLTTTHTRQREPGTGTTGNGTMFQQPPSPMEVRPATRLKQITAGRLCSERRSAGLTALTSVLLRRHRHTYLRI